MKHFLSFILVVLALALTVGCQTRTEKLTTSHIVLIQGTNRAEITQPKDSKWAELTWNKDGIRILDYVSSANAGAIELESVRAKAASDTFMQGIMLGREGAQMYLRSQGIPLPPNYQPLPPPATVSTNR